MSSPSFFSEHLDFNFNHFPTSPLSSMDSSESDSSLNITLFDYLTTSNNILTDPLLHEDDGVFMGPSEEELIPLPRIASVGSSRYGSKEELDTDDPF